MNKKTGEAEVSASTATVAQLIARMKADSDSFLVEDNRGPVVALVYSVVFNSDKAAVADFIRLMQLVEKLVAASVKGVPHGVSALFDSIQQLAFTFSRQGNDAFREYRKALESEVKS